MCGIAGIFVRASEPQDFREILTRMRDTMQHRGPDGGSNWISQSGRVGLAHRRLSIVDLSDTASQPMLNETSDVAVVFNGEIWNHLLLRRELIQAGHRFKTDHSDTEVIVHGYEEWGLGKLLARLDGDFSIAIWDQERQILSLARDRVGVKPLYFTSQNDIFLFASEIKAILEHPSVRRDIDPFAMYHYLSFLVTPAPMTMFKDVFKVPAGFYLQVTKDTFVATRYWDAVPGKGIDPQEIQGLSETELERFYIKGINSRLYDAVEKRMMSDVPFGVFLSGGVDSSTNVALMSQMMNRPVDTFTVGFKDHEHLNELEEADLVAKTFKTNHRQVLIGEKDMIGFLDDLIFHQDEPLADWVCIPLYFVSKLAKDSGVTVVQVGEGSDEQFCGYNGYMQYLRLYHRYWKSYREWAPAVVRRIIASAAKLAAEVRPKISPYADIFDRAARNREHFWTGAMAYWEISKEKLVNRQNIVCEAPPDFLIKSGLMPANYYQCDSFNVIQSFLGPFDEKFPKRDALTRMIYNEFKLRLDELLLMRVDKMTMATSVESRVPFLDHKLVEFTMDIPEKWKTKNKVPKYLLKKAVEGLIPHSIIYRRKMGFGAPMREWLRGAFGELVQDRILSSPLMQRGFLNRDYIQELCQSHRAAKADNSLLIWVLFNLTAWFDRWVVANEK